MSIIQYLHCMMGILCITDVIYGVCCCCFTAATLVGQGLRRLGISRDVSPLSSCHAAAFSGDNRVMSCTFASTSDEHCSLLLDDRPECFANVGVKVQLTTRLSPENSKSVTKQKQRNIFIANYRQSLKLIEIRKLTSFSFMLDLTSYLSLTSILVRKKQQYFALSRAFSVTKLKNKTIISLQLYFLL